MPNRAAAATKADLHRTLQAATAAGLNVLRIVVRRDEVEIQIGGPSDKGSHDVEPKRVVVL